MDIKKFIQDTQELEQAIEQEKTRASHDAAERMVVAFLQLQGVVYPSKSCFCNSATDDEVRSYYTSLFSALRHFGFSDLELRKLVAKHEDACVFEAKEGWEDEVDPLDIESWILRRGRICGTWPTDWARLVRRHLLDDK